MWPRWPASSGSGWCSDTPGFEPVAFDVDGFRFGMTICIEINFSDLFADYDRLGVDCLLRSAYPVDSIFATNAAPTPRSATTG